MTQHYLGSGIQPLHAKDHGQLQGLIANERPLAIVTVLIADTRSNPAADGRDRRDAARLRFDDRCHRWYLLHRRCRRDAHQCRKADREDRT
jgi:hypothetical protein